MLMQQFPASSLLLLKLSAIFLHLEVLKIAALSIGCPKGIIHVRVFFRLVNKPSFDREPLFDVSVEGT